MKLKISTFSAILLAATAANAQPIIQSVYEIDGAADIRATFDPNFTDRQFDAAKAIAAEGDTLIISRTFKYQESPYSDPNEPLIPGEVLIYRKNTNPSDPRYNLVGRLNDSVVGSPGVSLVDPDDRFGWAIALEGNTLVVSATYYPVVDDTSSTNPGIVQDPLIGYGPMDAAGAAFVYTRPSAASDTWTLLQVIYSPVPVNGEILGRAVKIHDGRLFIVAPRAFVPGFSAYSGGCNNNFRSEINVYELSSSTNQYELIQEIIPPFMEGEPAFEGVSNGDPVDLCPSGPPVGGDNSGGNTGGSQNYLPILSRIDPDYPGAGSTDHFSDERASDIALDGDWLVTAAATGVYIFRLNEINEYVVHTVFDIYGWPAAGSIGGAGFTSVDIDGETIVLGTKKYDSPTHTNNGALFICEYNSLTDSWERTASWDELSGQIGRGVSIENDSIIAYAGGGAKMFRYDRANNQLLSVGKPDIPGGSQIIRNKAVFFEGHFLLPDGRSHASVESSDGPNTVRAVRACPYDLDDNGVLDFFDFDAFMNLYTSNNLQADYALPYGTLDIDDITHYLDLYNSGCP